jgi:hypothetical protein
MVSRGQERRAESQGISDIGSKPECTMGRFTEESDVGQPLH